jgi:hypothetical protein
MRLRRTLLIVAGALLAVFLLIQLVPYGWTRSNPPVSAPAPWTDPEAEAIARRSCYDCHSNETEWPAYAYVAPMSWLVRSDVESGRSAMNLSEWDEETADAARDADDEIEDGDMPLATYLRLHPDADLSDEEAVRLAEALDEMGRDDGDG